MKKIFFLLMALAAFQFSQAQLYIPRQVIPYDVNYHWGIIDVMIAHGTVKVQSDADGFHGTLDGTSIPWEGRIICVSDTLDARMSDYGGLRETVDYQSGWYRRPTVSDFRSSGYNAANPLYYKNIAGQGEYDASNDSMEAITVTSDMIGMYYFAHALDFTSLRPGDRVTVPIEGRYAREVVITYNGESSYSYNGNSASTYDCTFEYSYGGGMSGYPVECKINQESRVLVYISASLPVGKVEMLCSSF